MTVKKSTFQALAKQFLSKDFADFAESTTVTTTTGFDYATQVATTTTETFDTIRVKFKETQFDGQQIKIGDFKLIGCLQDLAVTPSVENTTVTRLGKVCNIVQVSPDPADATITLHVRPQ